MPSAPGYKRNYKQERKTSLERGEAPDNAARKRARRALEAEGRVKPHDGKDVDHVTPLSKGGSVGKGNLRVKSVSSNRSFPRTPSGAVKSTK